MLTSIRSALLLALFTAGSSGASFADTCAPIDDDLVDGQVLVMLAPGVTLGQILADYPVSLVESLPEISVYALATQPGADVHALVAAMSADPRLAEAEPNRLLITPEGVQLSIPDLDFAANRDTFLNQPSAVMVNTTQAHVLQAGAGTSVAVVDTGMVLDHPDLDGMVVDQGYDFVENTGTAAFRGNDHATHVAGVIHLAAPGARIVPIRALGEDGRGTVFAIARGIVAAVHAQVDVINLSFSMTHDSLVVEAALEYADDFGIILVASTGNRGLDCVEFPASDQRVIAVAAVSPNRARVAFSNVGTEVAVSAPGVEILSMNGHAPYASWGGTSFAAPFVAGAAALLVEKYPGLPPAGVRAVLRASAQPDASPELAGLMGTGVVDLAGVAQALTTDRTTLKLENGAAGTVLRWSPVLGATTFDVVRGALQDLALQAGTIQLGPLTCIASNTTTTSTAAQPDSATPPEGQAFFYLIRDDALDVGGGSYGRGRWGEPRIPGPSDCPVP